MKVEGEFGFEPSLVIEMERITENRQAIDKIKDRKAKQTFKPERGSRSVHRAFILKDRSDTVNGLSFEYTADSERNIFDDIKPHFELLNIGGMQLGVGTEDSQDRFDKEGRPEWKRDKELKEVALEEIQGSMVSMWPGTDKESKKFKTDFLKIIFDTRSWAAVEKFTLTELQLAAVNVQKFEGIYRKADEGATLEELWQKTKIPPVNDADLFPPEEDEPEIPMILPVQMSILTSWEITGEETQEILQKYFGVTAISALTENQADRLIEFKETGVAPG